MNMQLDTFRFSNRQPPCIIRLGHKQAHIDTPSQTRQATRQVPRGNRLEDGKVDETDKRPKVPARLEDAPELGS